MTTARSSDGLLRIIVIVIGGILLLPLLMMLFMMPMMGMMGWWWTGGGPSAGVGFSPMWGIGMMLLFLVVLLGIGYFLYRAVTRGVLSGNDSALEELRIAYARGDLSQEEFEQRREDLQRSE
jgi:putative membrane protein